MVSQSDRFLLRCSPWAPNSSQKPSVFAAVFYAHPHVGYAGNATIVFTKVFE
ncbi:hypothetical protein [Leadbettera azotonutricia]|uniref:Uncharacterized protein n=1 Tax=Leadbettera azotonutricia (strain ATCC BAA-888 / DSM 13862 / ZAS-9) TaxID=545695 RepID=F5YE36_LEAAZ|nr:hypothetical protein [Leadbettera azotonutricia]AEF80356.1 hypothetical protein TREAZ_1517 [Leadbettera azotonutricia ZAS-9]